MEKQKIILNFKKFRVIFETLQGVKLKLPTPESHPRGVPLSTVFLPASPAVAVGFFTSSTTWEAPNLLCYSLIFVCCSSYCLLISSYRKWTAHLSTPTKQTIWSRWPWPATAWSRASGLRQWEHQILATRPAVNDKVQALQKRIPTKIEGSEVFIRRKSTVCVDRHRHRLRESLNCTLVAVWITFMRHFFQFSFGQSFWFAWFKVHTW